MENEVKHVSDGDLIYLNMKHRNSKIKHLRDLFHSENMRDVTCQSPVDFSKFNRIGFDRDLKYCESKTGEQNDIVSKNLDREVLLPLQHFVFVMPPGTVFGAPTESRELCCFCQRIQHWNTSLREGSNSWADVLKNMAIENISPFPVCLKLFLRTTRYFIAMSEVGVHVYGAGSPPATAAPTAGEVLELEEMIGAKLDGSREDREELRGVVAEILFDSATQNVWHPRVEVTRREEGDLLLVTLQLRTAAGPDRNERHLPEINEEEGQLEGATDRNAVGPRISSQRSESGCEPAEMVNGSTQMDGSNARDELELCEEKECDKQEAEDVLSNGTDKYFTKEMERRFLKKPKSRSIQDAPKQEETRDVEDIPLKTAGTTQIDENREGSIESSFSSDSKLKCKEGCLQEQVENVQSREPTDETTNHAVQELVDRDQSLAVSKPITIIKRVFANDEDEVGDVDLCMTVDAPSDEDYDSDASSDMRDADLSVFCDVEMYSVESPGHKLWDNMGVYERDDANDEDLNVATVLSENTNLSDKDLSNAIQSRFKNIKVYQNKNPRPTKAKEKRKGCNKENSTDTQHPGIPDRDSASSLVNNIDVANISCAPEDASRIDYVSKPERCQRRTDGDRSDGDERSDSILKQKLKLLQMDPTVDLDSDNVYVLFNKKLVPAPAGAAGDTSSDPTYCCGLCGEKFRSYKDLVSHARGHRKSRVVNVTVYAPSARKKPAGKCKDCGRPTAAGGECTGASQSLCDVCGKLFHGWRRLWSHFKSQHRLRPKRPGLCHRCGETFSDTSTLRRHIESRHGAAPPPRFACDYCGKAFTTKHQIARHVKIHLGLKPFECVACGMRFGVKMRWREHMYLHSGAKPYSCDACGQEFRHMSALSLHRKMHRLGKI